MRFEDVIGHDSIKTQLKQGITSGRISHAVMFTGITGTGILPMALAYASELIVHHSENKEAARNNCDKLIHADLHLSYPVNTTKQVTKDPKALDFIHSFREAFLANPYLSVNDWLEHLGIERKSALINVHEAASINRQLQLKAYEGGYKVMAIWLPERMNQQAANKLLKLLEEPPAKTVFVLACEQPDLLLPTIISRVQIVRLPPLPTNLLAEKIAIHYQLGAEEANSIATLAEGSYTNAIHTIDAPEGEETFKNLFQDWMRFLYAKKIYDILSFTEQISKYSREQQKLFLAYGLHIFRECLIMNYGTDSLQRLNDSERQFVNKFAPFINSANAMQMVHEFEETVTHIDRNANARIIFLDLSLRAMKLIRVKPTAA